jgi:hypothetical protein
VLADRPRFHDTNRIAGPSFASLIMDLELGPARHDPLVERMGHSPTHFHDNRLLHLRPCHNTDFLLPVSHFRR